LWQGSAADIIKLAMVQIDEELLQLQAKQQHAEGEQGDKARLIMQVLNNPM
jgi:DNA polymerase I-like protein with 3'-5' exonuclease and polymerase domains